MEVPSQFMMILLFFYYMYHELFIGILNFTIFFEDNKLNNKMKKNKLNKLKRTIIKNKLIIFFCFTKLKKIYFVIK